MRELKFRAWDFDNNEMVTADSEGYCFVMYDGKPELLVCYDDEHGFIKCNHVMLQYTGLKDKNGVEIYEGDIIESEGGATCEVVFHNGGFMVNTDWFKGRSITLEKPLKNIPWEVIGNICETPELVDGGEA